MRKSFLTNSSSELILSQIFFSSHYSDSETKDIFVIERPSHDLTQFSSVQSLSRVQNSFQHHGLKHARLPCCLRQKRISLLSGRPKLDTWFWKIFWRKKYQPTSVFLSGEFHEKRRVAGFSLWHCKQLDMAERLTHTHKCTYTITIISTFFSTHLLMTIT